MRDVLRIDKARNRYGGAQGIGDSYIKTSNGVKFVLKRTELAPAGTKSQSPIKTIERAHLIEQVLLQQCKHEQATTQDTKTRV